MYLADRFVGVRGKNICILRDDRMFWLTHKSRSTGRSVGSSRKQRDWLKSEQIDSTIVLDVKEEDLLSEKN